jgi:spore coat polysaccharide biosynthesis predicted glycosyltransferase SpsG
MTVSELKKLGKLILMDDFGKQGYPADVVINYNIYAKELPYERLYPQDTMRLLGCSYVPLRDEFVRGEQRALRNQRERNEDKAQSNYCDVRNVLISTGGADEFNLAGALIRRLKAEPIFTSLVFRVVVGPLNKNYPELVQMSEVDPHIIVHHNVSDMAVLMQHCDAAISAGGSTLYELCACGVPTVSFSFADNQLQGVRGFSEHNIISYAGDMRWKPEETLEIVVQKLSELCSDAELRSKLSMKMQELVDGFGARRIAEKLLMIL